MCPYKVILLLVIKYNREYDIYINIIHSVDFNELYRNVTIHCVHLSV